MTSQSPSFIHHADSSKQLRVTILGSGIVGSALAFYLSTRLPFSQIMLLDPSPPSPTGSTTIAPGLVGQLNTIPQLTSMAKETVQAYSKISGGFQQNGGLEIASTLSGITQLHQRLNLAGAFGLEAKILTSEEVANLAPDFHVTDKESKGLFFPSDGTADPTVIMRHFQEQAKVGGVSVVSAEVLSISINSAGEISLHTQQELLQTDRLIIAAGIWTPAILKPLGIDIPIFPVAHPYGHGPNRERRKTQQPFVRWPERVIYGRDHGECDGFGTYDHEPVVCVPGDGALSSAGPDPQILETALSVFSKSIRGSKAPYRAFNGIFAVTPDSMPFAGTVPRIPGLYIAAAVWITQAAGVARLVADIVSEKTLTAEDEVVRDAFDPMRFEGQESGILKRRALGTYNDIYNKTKH